jgi:hypothetical protein
MDVKEYEAIKRKVTTLQQGIERSKGAQEQIMSNLATLGINSEDEAQKRLLSLDTDIKAGERKILAIEADLAELADWASL